MMEALQERVFYENPHQWKRSLAYSWLIEEILACSAVIQHGNDKSLVFL